MAGRADPELRLHRDGDGTVELYDVGGRLGPPDPRKLRNRAGRPVRRRACELADAPRRAPPGRVPGRLPPIMERRPGPIIRPARPPSLPSTGDESPRVRGDRRGGADPRLVQFRPLGGSEQAGDEHGARGTGRSGGRSGPESVGSPVTTRSSTSSSSSKRTAPSTTISGPTPAPTAPRRARPSRATGTGCVPGPTQLTGTRHPTARHHARLLVGAVRDQRRRDERVQHHRRGPGYVGLPCCTRARPPPTGRTPIGSCWPTSSSPRCTARRSPSTSTRWPRSRTASSTTRRTPTRPVTTATTRSSTRSSSRWASCPATTCRGSCARG